ncbi:MAG: hypothetical protein LAO20_16825 [Acidobacteriia bacterium]|nr:hypothetical protein [Terriglobia bacterium]
MNSESGTLENVQNVQITPSTPALLPLDQPRIIAIRDGKYTYTFHFSRISQAEWERYFASITVTARNVTAGRETTIDAQSALIELAESKLFKVEGYSGDIMAKTDWQKRIWPRHMLPASQALIDVLSSTEEAQAPADGDSMEVLLDALWSAAADGSMTKFKGLAHRFSPPTVNHKRAFLSAGSKSTVVGGSRDGATVFSKRHKALLSIYDELVLSVDGYAINGCPLEGPENIRREMDAYHKFVAVDEIFRGPDISEAQEAA